VSARAKHNLRPRGLIGLDLGAHTIKAAQLNPDGSVHAWACFPRLNALAPGEASLSAPEADRLARVLRQRGFGGDRIALAAPRSVTRAAVLDLPPKTSGAPIDRIARSEMARLHAKAEDKIEIALIDLPRAARATSSTQALTYMCAHDASARILDALEATDYEPVTMDVAALATIRGCFEGAPPETQPGEANVVIDAGWGSTDIYVMTEGRLVFERPAPAAALAIAADDAFHAGARDAEAQLERFARSEGRAPIDNQLRDTLRKAGRIVAAELERSLGFVQARFGIQRCHRVTLVGGGASLLEIGPMALGSDWSLARARRRDLESIFPQSRPLDPTTPPTCARMATALGLAALGDR